MSGEILQTVLPVALVVVLAVPLGKYIGKVMNGEKVFCPGRRSRSKGSCTVL